MVAKNASGLNSPVNESQGGTNASTFNQARTNMGLNPLISEKTLTYNVVAADRGLLIHYSGAGGVDLTLDPAATLGDGFNFILRNDAVGNITINPNGAELINGAATLAVESGQAVTVISTGTAFYTEGQAAQIDGANTALSNLTATAINTSLVSDTDITDNLGSQAIRWNAVYAQSVQTGDTAADTLTLSAWDVDGAASVPFFTLTANNTPTAVLASAVTATTQAASDNSTKLATTAYADNQVTTIAANKALSNLVAVAINTTLVSDTDITDDLGSPTIRWANTYSSTIRTGSGAGNTTILQARDVDGAAWTDFITLTANNTPTAVLSGDVTGATQAPGDNTTKLATTAFVSAATGGGSGANVALSNLAGVAINTTLVSDTDVTDDLGTITARWNNVYAQNISTDHTAGHTTVIGAWDVDGASLTPFMTLTANNTPTGVLASAVTGTTQAASDNSTKLATTAYADTQVTTIAANKALSNLASVAINTSLLPGSDNSIDLGDGTHRTRQIYSAALTTGTSAGNTLIISARDVDGASDTTFITLTANNTPTCVIASAVTGTTQSASDNSTKLATTAYVDSAIVSGGGQTLDVIPYVSGVWYPAIYRNSDVAGSVLRIIGNVYYYPFIIAVTNTFTDISIIVSTLAAAGTGNVAIYASNVSNTQPTGNPIANTTTGSFSVASTGVKNFTFPSPVALTNGLYWLADLYGTLAPVVVVCPGNSSGVNFRCLGFSSVPTSSSAVATANVCYKQVYAFNAVMPTVSGLTLVQNTYATLAFLKAQ